MEKGYVYILSNSQAKGILKVGRTSDEPQIRAKHLSRQTGAIGEFKVEWSKEVPNLKLAEAVLHYKLHPFSFAKEYFKLPLESAIRIAEEVLNAVFEPHVDLKKLVTAEEKARKLGKAMGVKLKVSAEKEADQEATSGVRIIPIGQKLKTWDQVIGEIDYSFGRKAIRLCLKEGKQGDPSRKRFIAYRTKYDGIDVISLFFTSSYIRVNIKGNKPHVKRVVSKLFPKADLIAWREGYSFNVSTDAQYAKLEKWLQMGKKRINTSKG